MSLADVSDLAEIVSTGPVLPRVIFCGPCTKPTTSWNHGPVLVMTVAIYPEAWKAVTGCDISKLVDVVRPLDEVAGGPLLDLCQDVMSMGQADEGLRVFFDGLQTIWPEFRPPKGYAANLVGDWSRLVLARAMSSTAGKSARQLQRRIKSWTGQNQRELEAHARVENLYREIVIARKDGQVVDLAQFATEHGFADQSHMGRVVREKTGWSPAKINHLIDEHESFWFYRLIGERY